MKLTSNSVCENDLQNKNSIKKITMPNYWVIRV